MTRRNRWIAFAIGITMLGFGLEGLVTGGVYGFGGKYTGQGGIVEFSEHPFIFLFFEVIYLSVGINVLWGVLTKPTESEE